MEQDETPKLVGRGLFSRIWKVGDIVLKKTVLDDQVAPHDCQLEVSLLRNLTSKNIIQYLSDDYEYNEDADKVLILKLPYMPFSLNSYLLKFHCKANFPNLPGPKWRNVISESKGLEIFRQITLGLKYLHEQGIIHRDLKPDNIAFSGENSIPVIMDLDVAWKAGCRPEEKDEPLICDVSTACYRAPELLFGLNYSSGIDMWDLGLLFCKIFSSDPTSDVFGPYTTDIALISSIFERRGFPSQEDWPTGYAKSSVLRSMSEAGNIDRKTCSECNVARFAPLCSANKAKIILERLLIYEYSQRSKPVEVLSQLGELTKDTI